MNYYEDSRVEVTVKQVWNNGVLREEIPYTQDQIHGVAKTHYESGKLHYETPYSKGQIHGIHKSYYESGKVEYQYYYIHGNTVSQEKYKASLNPCGKTIVIDGEEWELVKKQPS